MQFISSLPYYGILVFSIIFHEVAHGQMALWRGDTTARDAGRLTFNPLPHIDLFGTILFPLILIVMKSSFLFGWARPVPIDPRRFGQARQDMALVGAAGPASNIILAIILGQLFRWSAASSGAASVMSQALFFGVMINLVLAVFNLIPIPPLDGSRIVLAFLPRRFLLPYMKLERFGMLIVFLAFYLGLFRVVVMPVVRLGLGLILGSGPY